MNISLLLVFPLEECQGKMSLMCVQNSHVTILHTPSLIYQFFTLVEHMPIQCSILNEIKWAYLECTLRIMYVLAHSTSRH